MGNLPGSLRATIEAEDVEFTDGPCWMTSRMRNYRAPGAYASHKLESRRGRVYVTGMRLYVGGFINVPWTMRGVEKIAVATRDAGSVVFSIDLADMPELRSSGSISVTVRTKRVAELVAAVQAHQRDRIQRLAAPVQEPSS